ncbi:hypothetical protein D9M70_517390 [compost metagenome]
MRMAVRTVLRSLARSSTYSPSTSTRWRARLTEPRLQTAVSSSDVFSVISVQRLEPWITPTWSCGLRRLHSSFQVIHGLPVSNRNWIILRHTSSTGFWKRNLPSRSSCS